MSTLFSLQGKVAVVTGGTGVLGEVMCRGLASAGAAVAVLGRREDAAERISNEINKAGGKAIPVVADVLNKLHLIQAKEKINLELGKIDILVNGAGGNLAGAVIAPDKTFFNLNLKDFDEVVDLNLKGTVLPCQIFTEDMVEKKKGVIINISSMAAFRPLTRVVGYSVAKSAVTSFTQWLSVEMAKKFGQGIRVNAIAPGFFLTEQNRKLLTNDDGSYTQRGQSAINQTPFARFGKPEELIGTLVWLCSDASAFVTGVNIPVDGGFNAFAGV